MHQRIAPLTVSLLALAVASLSGCGILPDSKKIDYKSQQQTQTNRLETPPDLTRVTRDDRYSVPDTIGRGTATYSGYNAERSKDAARADSDVLPAVEKVRLERSGNQRWLVTTLPSDKLWNEIRAFWQETGFIIAVEMPEAGVMETEWNENRAKIPDDFLRRTIGRVLDALYSTGERDKFRTRIERGSAAGTTEIYISHRGMEEVYTSQAKDETRWQPRAVDPELEAEMLQRLMVRLGTEEKKAEIARTTAASQPVTDRARLVNVADGAGTLQVDERFDRAWRRVGLALDRVGFTVEDRDRSNGQYFVRYVDADQATKSKGWFSAFKKDPVAPNTQYRIHVKDAGEQTEVRVLTKEGGNDRSDTAKRIMKLLQEQLK